MRNLTYSIGDASKKTGITQKQIRNWEAKGYIHPERVISGNIAYRRFTPNQVETIRLIKEYQEQGFLLSVAVKKASEEISQELKTE